MASGVFAGVLTFSIYAWVRHDIVSGVAMGVTWVVAFPLFKLIAIRVRARRSRKGPV